MGTKGLLLRKHVRHPATDHREASVILPCLADRYSQPRVRVKSPVGSPPAGGELGHPGRKGWTMAARADTRDPDDRVTRTDGVAEVTQSHRPRCRRHRGGPDDAATDDGVVEREVVVGATNTVVADTDTLDHGQHVDPDAEVVADRAVRDEIVAARRSASAASSSARPSSDGSPPPHRRAPHHGGFRTQCRDRPAPARRRGDRLRRAQVLGIAGVITIAAISSWPTSPAATSPDAWPASAAPSRASRCGCGRS